MFPRLVELRRAQRSACGLVLESPGAEPVQGLQAARAQTLALPVPLWVVDRAGVMPTVPAKSSGIPSSHCAFQSTTGRNEEQSDAQGAGDYACRSQPQGHRAE